MIEVAPDIKFKKELQRVSKAPLNKCMQCGTCSVVCSIAPEEKPFPRKEMIWAGWGMKEKLVANMDVWLCHQCGDCSTHCPRDVKPADVLSSIRQLTYKEYSRPRMLGIILGEIKWLPVAILIPVVIIAAILGLAGTLSIPTGDVNYSAFFPHIWLNTSFTFLTFLSYGFALWGLGNFIKDIKKQFPGYTMKGNVMLNIFKSFGSILSHKKFSGCSTDKTRKIAHVLVFYGFILLLLVTVYAIIAALTDNYPLELTDPFKILGNIAALMLFVGLGIMMVNRGLNSNEIGSSNYSDWLLLVSLFLLTLSGLIVEFARFGNWISAYYLYFGHLVCVWFVVIYLPYTKFGHTVYRLVALGYAKGSGRD